jgi:heme-degrading monooxygenase HmoA
MYARIASFEERDPSLTDELIQRAREKGPASVPGTKGFIGLMDRERGTSLSITFFDSEEDIRNSEQAFEDMAQDFPPEMRGRRTSVDVYEVTIFEGDAERAKAARVNTFEGSPDRIDDSVSSVRDETLPKLREMYGNVGLISLADRDSGRVIGITLWESADALRVSEQDADRLREEAAESGDQRIAGVDRYEVAIAQQLSGVRA